MGNIFLVEKRREKGKWEKVNENYWKIIGQLLENCGKREREKREDGRRGEKREKGKKNEKKGERGEKGRRREEKGGKERREGWETQKTTSAPEISETRSFP